MTRATSPGQAIERRLTQLGGAPPFRADRAPLRNSPAGRREESRSFTPAITTIYGCETAVQLQDAYEPLETRNGRAE